MLLWLWGGGGGRGAVLRSDPVTPRTLEEVVSDDTATPGMVEGKEFHYLFAALLRGETDVL